MKTKEITLPVKVEVLPERAERKSKSELRSLISVVTCGMCMLLITYILVVLFLALERAA